MEKPNIRVCVDAMGGDHAPEAVVAGVLLALNQYPVDITLVGDAQRLNPLVVHAPNDRLRIHHAAQVIETAESPTTALKEKKDASMLVGLRMLKEDRADAFVSAGNTGALLAGGLTIVGRKSGILRPTLAALIPCFGGVFLLADSGANVDCKPDYLAQFAAMGKDYMISMGIENPRVGLLSIGAEPEKGNALTKEAFGLLEGTEGFIGNVEGRDLPNGICDVCVCDGFSGNVLLKFMEGFAQSTFKALKADLMGDPLSKIGAFFSRKAYQTFKQRFDYESLGGAPFLGLNRLVIKAHGASNGPTIAAAVGQCVRFVSGESGVGSSGLPF